MAGSRKAGAGGLGGAGVLVAVALAGCVYLPFPVEATAYALEVDAPLAMTTLGYDVDKVAFSHVTIDGGRLGHEAVAGDLAAPAAGLRGARSSTVAEGTAAGAVAEARSLAEGVVLLGGLVVADAVRAVAKGGPGGFDASGSAFVGLVVAGVPVPDPVPGTTIPLADGAVVRLKEVVTTGDSLRVTMLQVTAADGTQVLVGRAFVRLAPVGGAADGCSDARAEAAVAAGHMAGQEVGVSRTVSHGGLGPGNSRGYQVGAEAGGAVHADNDGTATFAGTSATSGEGNAWVEMQQMEVVGMDIGAEAVHLQAGARSRPDLHSTWMEATYVDLEVFGGHVTVPVAPNTRMGPFPLPGGGEVLVVLNEQHVVEDAAAMRAEARVVALHLIGTHLGKPLDLRVGTAEAVVQACVG